MPLKKKDQQVREVRVTEDGISSYKVVKGEQWSSGYDERASDEINEMGLDPGVYIVSFYPVGVSKGWDSITRLRCIPKSEWKGAGKIPASKMPKFYINEHYKGGRGIIHNSKDGDILHVMQGSKLLCPVAYVSWAAGYRFTKNWIRDGYPDKMYGSADEVARAYYKVQEKKYGKGRRKSTKK